MGPAGAAANANAITNVNLNVNVGVNLDVGVNVNSIRQFRYLLHFRQGAWLGVASISAAESDCICLQHFAACPVPSSLPSLFPCPFIHSPSPTVTAFAFNFRRAFYPIN